MSSQLQKKITIACFLGILGFALLYSGQRTIAIGSSGRAYDVFLANGFMMILGSALFLVDIIFEIVGLEPFIGEKS